MGFPFGGWQAPSLDEAAGPNGTVYLRYGLDDGMPGTEDTSAPGRGLARAD